MKIPENFSVAVAVEKNRKNSFLSVNGTAMVAETHIGICSKTTNIGEVS